MNKIPLFVMTMMILMFFPCSVKAQEKQEEYPMEKILEQQLQQIPLEKLEEAASKALSQQQGKEASIKEILYNVITGKTKISFSDLMNKIFSELFKQFFNNVRYLFEILLISVFCSLLKNLSDSFVSKSVSTVGFYGCYIVLIILLIRTFSLTMETAKETIFNMKIFVDALIPVLITLMLTTGNVMTASFFQPVILLSIEAVNTLIISIIIPMIYFMMIIQIVNYLAEKEMLTKLAELIQAGIKWSLVTIISLFLTIVSLYGLTAPVMDSLGAKTAKFAVGNFIPIVGGIMSDSVDLILNCSLIIKNGIGVVGIIVLGTICFLPLLQILAITIMYKLSAALIQPISEENIVECIGYIGTACSMLFASVLTVTFMFIIAVTAMVGAGNLTSMLR